MRDSFIVDFCGIEDRRYYVYAYRYPDTGLPFYIGKGKDNRDVQPKTNIMFQRIVAKLERDGKKPIVERISGYLSERDALHFEREEIARYGRRNNGTGILANFTDGGEGQSGLIHSQETRDRISAANAGKTRSEETRGRMSAAKRLSPPRSATGFKGVTLNKPKNKFRAAITVGGKRTEIGYFSTAREAALEYDAAAVGEWGIGNCYLNFPSDWPTVQP